MPGIYTHAAPGAAQATGVPMQDNARAEQTIPVNVAGIIVLSAAVLIAFDVFKFKFVVGVG